VWNVFKLEGLSAAAALFLAGAHCAPPAPSDPVVVRIGDRVITRAQFEAYVAASGADDGATASGDLKAALFEQFIEEQLLLEAAEEEGIQVPPASEPSSLESLPSGREGGGTATAPAAEERSRAHTRIRRLMGERILSGVSVSDEEVEAYYQGQRARFRRSEIMDISQILVEKREEAEQLRRQLLANPGRFEALARERSTGPESSAGGRLGVFRRGELPPAFENEVLGLTKRQLSAVVETDFGFHIFRVNDVLPAREFTLEEVKDAIRVELLQKQSDEVLARYIDGLRKRHPVEVFTESLSFPYHAHGSGRAGIGASGSGSREGGVR
jgi:hypothetical protein